MSKMSQLVMEVCELYDEDGLTIMEIVNELRQSGTDVSENMVIEALENFSETFGIV